MSRTNLPTSSGNDDAAEPDRRIEAEEAATAYWRSVALDRRVEAARVQRRPMVRAAIALDRRTRSTQDRVVRTALRVRAGVRRLAARADPGLGSPPAPGSPSPTAPGGHLGVELLTVRSAPSAAASRPTEREAVERSVEASDADIIVLVTEGVALEGGAVEALADALTAADVVAAVPTSVFPPDRWSAHAGAVRSAGATLLLDGSVPISEPLPPTAALSTTDLAVGGAIAIRRTDLLAAGGVGPTADASAALIDVGLRVSGDGRRVVAVASARSVEPDRPTRRVELRQRPAVDSAAWREVIDHHGPRIRRVATSNGHPVTPYTGWSAVITTATPSRKIAAHSGDWHFAGLFVDSLRRAGIEAKRQPISEAESLSGRCQDLHLVLRGLEPVRRTPGQVHVLWVISHPEALSIRECDEADLVLVASQRYAEHLATLTSTPVEVFEQATEPRMFRPDAAPARSERITVVANTRGVMRSSVAAALESGHTPTIHGLGWEEIVDPSILVAGYVAFEDLPALYASSEVVLNDHWDTMRLWGFVSNRVLDATAAGASVVSDHLPEITDRFEGTVPTWRDPRELAALLDEQSADPTAWQERASVARSIVLGAHTFDHRVAELDRLLRRHGLHPSPSSPSPPVPSPGDVAK